LKQQLLFLKEREKLFQVDRENVSSNINPSITTTTSITNSSSLLEPVINLSTMDDMKNDLFDEQQVEEQMNLSFPDKYVVPELPKVLLQDIDTGALHKFAPHHSNRQVLIDIVTHDLIYKYNLL
jgi:hypothetical protein